MPVRKAQAEWKGDLKSGHGNVSTESGALFSPYAFTSRFEDGTGTNPEELIGAAHSACFAMAFSHALASAGFPPTAVKAEDKVSIEKVGDGFSITKIEITCEGWVPKIDAATFQKIAEEAKTNCPVSKALAGTKLILQATLKS